MPYYFGCDVSLAMSAEPLDSSFIVADPKRIYQVMRQCYNLDRGLSSFSFPLFFLIFFVSISIRLYVEEINGPFICPAITTM